ncbi:MAG: type II toxin-antitoxin system VapC family toxin [Deltaproteobacteria bacterium]|nr:type II toxin-antitoxin system VapC family toxin [Deltaproteobacteria bacterium]
MIVVDTNQLAYLLIGGDATDAARRVFLQDPVWSAPLLWRSEFRSVLAQYLRRDELKVSQAIRLQEMAEKLLAGREHLLESKKILLIASKSKCSAYDCEFVALAKELRVPLVTSDKQILREFPHTAISPEAFVRRGA